MCLLLALGTANVRAQAPANPNPAMTRSSTWTADASVGALLDDPDAHAILQRHLPEIVSSPQIAAARSLSLRALKPYVPAMTDAVLAEIDSELGEVPMPAGTVPKPVSLPSAQEAFQLKTVPLWERGAHGSLGERNEDKPTLTVVVPIPEQATDAAVIVVPGGGYKALATNHEGRQVADWFAARGVTAFVLSYRLTPFGYHHPTQKLDGERAVRWVRAHAADYAIDPKRVGMIGFSAGGHITAMVGTQGPAGSPSAVDAIDRVSSRPDFMVLWYPGLLPMDRRSELLGNNPDPTTREQVLAVNFVDKATPPTFIFLTGDDELVPPKGILEFYSALQAAGAPAELHVFESGRHGMGFAMTDPALRVAPLLLESWLQRRGVLQRQLAQP